MSTIFILQTSQMVLWDNEGEWLAQNVKQISFWGYFFSVRYLFLRRIKVLNFSTSAFIYGIVS